MNIKVSLMAIAAIGVLTILGGTPAFAAEDKQAAKQPTEVTVQAGDTLEKIATAHDTDYVRLFNANDQLVSPDLIDVGDVIRLPSKDEELPDRFSQYHAAVAATYAAPVSYSYAQPTYNSTYATTSAPYAGGTSAGNSYAWGNCTWYAKNMRPDLPNRLGNGGSWSASAAAQGYTTGSAPRVGAVAEQPGHVAYVEAVNGNGTVTISEMNYNGGVGQVNRRTVSASNFNYIY